MLTIEPNSPRNDRCSPSPSEASGAIGELARTLTEGCADDRARALAIFEFVRDNVQFGFTRRFDRATPEHTLRARKGHCNPQARLMVALLRALGIPARYRVVWLPRVILDGLFGAALPQRLDHAFVELELDGRSLATDGYIVDSPLLAGARRELERTARRMGFGVHVDGRNDWDGRSRCMSQFVDPALALRDFGTFEEFDDHIDGANYSQRLGLLGRLGLAAAIPRANRRLDELRARA